MWMSIPITITSYNATVLKHEMDNKIYSWTGVRKDYLQQEHLSEYIINCIDAIKVLVNGIEKKSGYWILFQPLK